MRYDIRDGRQQGAGGLLEAAGCLAGFDEGFEGCERRGGKGG